GMATQEFPLSRVLRFRRRGAEAESRRRRSEVVRTELDVALEAARAFFMLYEVRAMVAILETQIALANQLTQAAGARYGAAQGLAADVLRAESEAARLEAELVGLRARARGAEAMLNAALARDPRLGVPELVALDASDTSSAAPSVEIVVRLALEHRPELAASESAIERADADIRVMRSMYAPMAMIGIGSAYTMAEGPGLMGMIGLTAPIYRARLRSGVSEARAMASAARAELEATRLMVAGEAARARAELEAAAARRDALRAAVVPRTRQAVDATLASYAAAALPLVSVLDAAQSLWSSEIALLEAEVALGVALVELERATGAMGDER
ncbi:MAG: TolC family protein, partial [Polyangiaceae bacterium]|nr:TolC family protein [Polyangiaceae bacterium]